MVMSSSPNSGKSCKGPRQMLNVARVVGSTHGQALPNAWPGESRQQRPGFNGGGTASTAANNENEEQGNAWEWVVCRTRV